MKYYIGIDGGGTHSRLLAADENSNPIERVFGASTNLASNSRAFVAETLRALFGELFTQSELRPEGCLGLCIGSAGLDSDDNCRIMESLVRENGFSCPITAVNDSLLALAAALNGKSGVIVISGTGSIAYGMDNNGETFRCGGWGHIFDDSGSGYWIGREALRRAYFAYDGRGKATSLTEAFRKEFMVSDLADALSRIYGENELGKADIARFSLFVEQGARRGDGVCLQILRDAAASLFALADAILKKGEYSPAPVVCVSGGSIENNDILFDEFAELMKRSRPETQVTKIEVEPVWGAIYLAIRQRHTGENQERLP